MESLGLATSLFSIVGDDDAGVTIIDSLEEENIDCTGIVLVEDKVTTVKNRLIASRPSLITKEQLLLRWDIEDDGNITEEALEALIDSALEKMEDSDVLVISDYGHGVLTDWGTEKLIKAAKNAKIPTICSSLEQALDCLDSDREFLTKGGVFSDSMIDAYIDLKMEDVTRLRMSTHPLEFEMYYSV